ncbi:hypothetical protein MTO96_042249 [Rhipicephalus appendiculatus]
MTGWMPPRHSRRTFGALHTQVTNEVDVDMTMATLKHFQGYASHYMVIPTRTESRQYIRDHTGTHRCNGTLQLSSRGRPAARQRRDWCLT